MRVDELVRGLLRRPVGILLVLVFAVLGAAVGWNSASPTYSSRATVLVIPPESDGGAVAQNPFLNLDFGMSQLALTIGAQLKGDDTLARVTAAGGFGDYTVDTLSSDNPAVAQLTPLVSFGTNSGSADGARAAAQVLVDQATSQLDRLQAAAKVAKSARATVVVSVAPTAGTPAGSSQLRSAGALGLAAGFAALVVLLLLQARTSRRVPPGRVDRLDRLGRAPSGATVSLSRAEVHNILLAEWERSGSNIAPTRQQLRDEERALAIHLGNVPEDEDPARRAELMPPGRRPGERDDE